jgi:DNA processing protein
VAEGPRDAAREPVRCACAGEPGYPAALRDLADAPARVWLRGDDVPAAARCVAIVGSRAASPYGRSMATRLARDLAGLGFTIVSGLARGIDAAAHDGALAAGGTTVAVVPSGLDQVTPPAHDALAATIAGRGTLLSEVAAGPPFGRGAFVRRNRLIAALAATTVVVEAAERSGALSTAAAAVALGRGLCAVPGDLDRPTARGVLALLRGGARVCADASDVLAAGASPPRAPAARPEGATSAAAAAPLARLAAALSDTPRNAETLAAACGLPLSETLAALLRLEWAGLARPAGGQRWRRAGAGRA